EAACLFRGTVDGCFFHPRDVFRYAIVHNASALIVAHNHPSGSPRPSPEDIEITRQLEAAGELLQVPIVDHVIITRRGYFSFLEAGMMRSREISNSSWPVEPSPD